MAYVVKWIGKPGKPKRAYVYEQHSIREGKKVKTRSRYKGPLHRFLSAGASYGMVVRREINGERNAHKLFEQKAADAAEKAAVDKVAHEARFTFAGVTALNEQTPEESFRHESGLGQENTASEEAVGAEAPAAEETSEPN